MSDCPKWICKTGMVLAWIVFICLAVWGAGVVCYCLNLGGWGVIGYALMLAAAFHYRKRRWVKPLAWALVVGLSVYYSFIPPSNDREWQASWSRMPFGKVEGNTLVLENVRDFHYRTTDDFDVRYVTKTYDLDKLVSLDFVVSHWDNIEAVSHTLLSFGFSDGQYLAFSAETRLDKDDEQGALAGLFKRFELLFIFATEQDLLALRTNYRHEDLYLYRVAADDRQIIRTILLDFVRRANELRSRPQFYNTVVNNCTTALRSSLEKGFSMPSSRWNVPSLLNGFVDRQAFEKGFLQHLPGESFDALRRRSLVPYDTAKDNPVDYSRCIRDAALLDGAPRE